MLPTWYRQSRHKRKTDLTVTFNYVMPLLEMGMPLLEMGWGEGSEMSGGVLGGLGNN